jgi:hypothetical protein
MNQAILLYFICDIVTCFTPSFSPLNKFLNEYRVSFSSLHLYYPNSPTCDHNCSTQISMLENPIAPHRSGKILPRCDHSWHSWLWRTSPTLDHRRLPMVLYAECSQLLFSFRFDIPTVDLAPVRYIDTIGRRIARIGCVYLPARCINDKNTSIRSEPKQPN